MATLRIRFKLNPGRSGIALGKLSKQTENIEGFLRAIAANLGEDDGPNLWQAKDFRNGSVFSTAEYQAVVSIDRAQKFNEGVEALAKFNSRSRKKLPDYLSPTTIDRFAAIRQGLDVDEQVGISLFDADSGKPKRWHYLDRLLLEEISQSIDPEVNYIGAVIGRTHEWNKGARDPYIVVRELHSDELIKCIYDDKDYSRVVRLFNNKSAVVIVDGEMRFNRVTSKTEVIRATGFELAPDFSDQDYEKFFGCAPDFTGGMTGAAFIAQGRDDG